MPREFAKVKATIWQDDDFRDLTPAAQHLYFVLLTDPNLSYCGVADWRAGRIAAKAKGWSTVALQKAAVELSRDRLIVADEETEEVLVRSFLRHDGVMQHNKLCISAATAFGSVASKTIRGVIVHELNRLRDEFPEWPTWERQQVQEVLKRNAVDPGSVTPLAPGVAPRPAPNPGAGESQGLEQGYNNNGNSNVQLSTSTIADATDDEERDDVRSLCEHLRNRIVGNGSKRPQITKDWAKAARLLIDKDGRDVAEAHRLIDWCQSDSFWASNVMSMTKFRTQYDQLRLKSQAASSRPGQRPSGYDNLRVVGRDG